MYPMYYLASDVIRNLDLFLNRCLPFDDPSVVDRHGQLGTSYSNLTLSPENFLSYSQKNHFVSLTVYIIFGHKVIKSCFLVVPLLISLGKCIVRPAFLPKSLVLWLTLPVSQSQCPPVSGLSRLKPK
jgi:hypothetical protein